MQEFNFKSKELYINLSPKDIPPKGHPDYSALIDWEEKKCKGGVTVGGVLLPGSLYFKTNHLFLDSDVLDEFGNSTTMLKRFELRDIDWIIHNTYHLAQIEQIKELFALISSRQIGKTVDLAVLLLHSLQFFPKTNALLLADDKGAVGNVTRYLTAMLNTMTDFLRIPLLDKDFNQPEVRFGYKETDNTDIIWNTLFIRNTQGGTKTEVSAGTTIRFAALDEIGRYNFSESLSALMPALKGKYGLRGVPYLVGTGGSFEKGKDAQRHFLKPSILGIKAFEQPDGVDTGLFLTQNYRQEAKDYVNLKSFLQSNKDPLLLSVTTGKPTNISSELDDLKIWVKNDEVAEKIYERELSSLLASNENIEALKYQAYYPKIYTDIFLSKSGNRFFREGLEQHKKWLESEYYPQHIELYKDTAGKIVFKNSDKLPIQTFPTPPDSLFKDCPIVIYDHPKYKEKYRAYKTEVAGCLLPEEKVLTDKGLMEIQKVTKNEKLINKEGKFVDIIRNIQYPVLNEDVYEVKMCNTLRTTTFTKEHPILVSDSNMNYTGKINENKFVFDFKRAEEIKEGQWIKYPNIYNTQSIPPELWENIRSHNIGKDILLDEDFWWIIGIIQGDGWVESNGRKITTCFNLKEPILIERYRNIIKKLFNRSTSIRQKSEFCIEVTFGSTQLCDFLNNNFGKYAYGKQIPEWVKKLENKHKLQLVLGYLQSDGCVHVDKKRNYYNIEFVSINLELLEDYQDILFSLGVVSSLMVLREEGIHKFKDIISNTKKCYSLVINHRDSIKLAKMYSNKENELKLSKIDTSKNLEKIKKSCFISDCGKYIYFKIKEIKKNNYTGLVYNFECDTNTFLAKHITTHNCDNYFSDSSETSDSLGSIYIVRRTNSNIEDQFHDTMVASFTSRPKTLNEFNKTVELLLEYYGCTVLHETNGTFIQYFDTKKKGHYLEDVVQLQREINSKTKALNTKGMAANLANKKFRYDLLEGYLDEETKDGLPGYTRIKDPMLIAELLAYNPDNKKFNGDRIDGFSYALVHLFKEKKYSPMAMLYEQELEPKKVDFSRNMFGESKSFNTFGMKRNII